LRGARRQALRSGRSVRTAWWSLPACHPTIIEFDLVLSFCGSPQAFDSLDSLMLLPTMLLPTLLLPTLLLSGPGQAVTVSSLPAGLAASGCVLDTVPWPTADPKQYECQPVAEASNEAYTFLLENMFDFDRGANSNSLVDGIFNNTVNKSLSARQQCVAYQRGRRRPASLSVRPAWLADPLLRRKPAGFPGLPRCPRHCSSRQCCLTPTRTKRGPTGAT
jgi:hypothetical protein